MFSKFIDTLRPKCEHMTIQELEESLKMRWDATNKLEKDIEGYRNVINKLREELKVAQYTAELDNKFFHKEMAKLENEVSKKAISYEEISNKYNELLNKIDKFHEGLFTKKESVPGEEYNFPISYLELNQRAKNSLLAAGIKTAKDIIEYPKEDLLRIKNFGRGSLRKVIEKMKEKGIDFDPEMILPK